MITLDDSTIGTLQHWFPGLELARIRVVERGPVCWYVRNVAKQGAMTIAPFIFYGRDTYDPSSARGLALLAHELVHVTQYRTYGHAGFLFRYFRDMAMAGGKYSRDLPLEKPCYELQAKVRETLEPRFL